MHHLCGLLTGNFFLTESDLHCFATWIHHFPYEWPISNIYLALSLCSHIASSSYWIVLTLAMSSNKCSKGQYKGVCVYNTFDHFNADGMPCKTCRAPWCFNASFFFDGKWTKYVHTTMSKLGSFFNLSCGKSTIICSTTLLLSLLQVTHLEILLCSLLSFLITQYPEDLINFTNSGVSSSVWRFLMTPVYYQFCNFSFFGRMIE